MTFTRFAIGAGVLLIAAFAVLMAIAVGGAFTPVVVFAALFALIGGGNLLYGKHSHGAAAQARRPAQEEQNRVIDEAQARAREEREQSRRQRAQARGSEQGGLRRGNGDVAG